MRDDEDRFSETQAFAAWGYAVLGLSAAASLGAWLTVPRLPVWLLLWEAGALGLATNLLCERTVVTGQEAIVSFGWLFPLYRRRIALADIASAEAVTYSPLADYGGWGIKWGRGGVALNARGDRGVQLTLRDGKRVLIGSQKPEALAQALTAPR